MKGRRRIMNEIRQKPYKKRLSMDLPIEIHVELKERSARRNITITKYIMSLVMEQLKKERSYD
jgi:hypothetical protein